MHAPQNRRTFLLLLIILFLMPVHASSGADRTQRRDASESAKKGTERERQFLYRAVEDLTRSQDYVKDTMSDLEKQIDAIELLEPSRRERDLRAFLDWYQTYADWLKSSAEDFEADLSRAYSEEPLRRIGPDRYAGMADGYARLGSHLGEQLARLEKANDRIEQRSEGLRRALEYIDSAAFREEKNRDKKQRQGDRDRRNDDLYEQYKFSTDVDILKMQQDLRSLGDQQKHLAVLIELGRMELSWLALKAEDSAALSSVARAISSDAPSLIEEAGSRVIKVYEADIASLRRKVEDVDRTRARIAPTGTLRTLDRIEELAGNYERMKSRYEHHISWLKEQIGAYRADVTGLRKGK
jgi:cell division protein FtsB